tara:strand:+ start:143 stop:292 length:150 start_codon:yes stop_codon:yes gene_type:complete
MGIKVGKAKNNIALINGIEKRGKGSFPRFNFMSDERYKKNYDKIFRKKK